MNRAKFNVPQIDLVGSRKGAIAGEIEDSPLNVEEWSSRKHSRWAA